MSSDELGGHRMVPHFGGNEFYHRRYDMHAAGGGQLRADEG